MKLKKKLQFSTEFPPWLFLRLGGGRKCGSGGDREPEATASALARSAVSRIQLAGPWDMAARNRAQSASGETPLLETGVQRYFTGLLEEGLQSVRRLATPNTTHAAQRPQRLCSEGPRRTYLRRKCVMCPLLSFAFSADDHSRQGQVS